MSSTSERAATGGRRTKLLFGVGAVAYGVKQTGFGGLLLLFYNQVAGLPAERVGLAIMIAMICDAVLDPVVGQLSDNLRTRWGRRHPFMYASAIPVAVLYWLLWTPPLQASQDVIFAWLVVMAVLVRTAITFFEIPNSALIPELAKDYDERTSFLSYRYLFAVAGGAAMGFATYRIFLTPDATHAVGQLNPEGYARYGAVAAVVMATAILVSCLGTHRHIPDLRKAEPSGASLAQTVREMAQSLANPALAPILMAALFGTMILGVTAGLKIYFDTYLWGLASEQIALFQLASLAAALLSVFVARGLSKPLGKRNAAIVLLAATVTASCAPILLRIAGAFPENDSAWLVPLLMVEQLLSAMTGIGCMILFSSMLTDVVDDNELRTGRRSEGLLTAAHSFVQKSVSGAGALLAGLLLTWVSFPKDASPEAVDPAIVHQLALVYLALAVCMSAAAMATLARYRITRASHAATLRALAAPGGAPSEEAPTPPVPRARRLFARRRAP